MKNLNTKALMVAVLLTASFLSTPMMVSGYDYENNNFYEQSITDPSMLITSFQGFGKIFSGLGDGGVIFASIFEMLLNQTLTSFSESDILPGVYVLSAFEQKTYNVDTKDYGTGQLDYYILPDEYNDELIETNTLGQAYCEVNKSGSYSFNVTKGASITLVIWDQDGSFIRAIEKLINFFNKILEYLEGPSPSGIPERLISEGIEVIAWFLIHINDIFTGDELFILNPITWHKVILVPDGDFKITKTWKVTGNDWKIDGDDQVIKDNGAVNSSLVDWALMAEQNNDTYMEYLLREEETILPQTIFTSFTFDILQLWVKNFELHINIAEIVNLFTGGGDFGGIPVADIFEGLNIEFYLFTHHFNGAYLYKDRFPDGRLTTNYIKLLNSTGDPVLVDGEEVWIPAHSEITHRLFLGDVDSYSFEEPKKPSSGANEFSWGLKLNDPEIVPVPVGVDLDSYFNPVPESLSYIYFGFTFQPRQTSIATRNGGTLPVLYGAVKLVQNFGPWNSPLSGDDHSANNPIDGLDLAVIYVSTILHFNLDLTTIGEGPDDTILDPNDDYNNVTHTLRIGDYLGKDIATKLDFIDIAGPDYQFGDELQTRPTAPASTSIIPVALLEYEMDRHDTFIENEDSAYETFATDLRLNIELNVFAYAVCFSQFEDGTGIWHDPTFSVYMVFEAQGFWAIILLVAGVGLVGVATILIKRRKDGRF